jgi:hypothetical protein
MFNQDYEKRLLRQHNGNIMSGGPSLEIRPFPTESPISGSFLVTSDATSAVTVTSAKAVNITSLILDLCRCHANGYLWPW